MNLELKIKKSGPIPEFIFSTVTSGSKSFSNMVSKEYRLLNLYVSDLSCASGIMNICSCRAHEMYKIKENHVKKKQKAKEVHNLGLKK